MAACSYEEDVHIPMFVRMPASARHPPSIGGVARAVRAPILNIDIAPSLLDLAGFGETGAKEMDGQSFLPLLDAATSAAVAGHNGGEGRAFLIEYFPIPHSGNDVQATPKGLDGWCTDPDVKREQCPTLRVTVDRCASHKDSALRTFVLLCITILAGHCWTPD